MTEPFYAVFDTRSNLFACQSKNVLVSALMSRRTDSPTVALLDYVVDGRIVLLYNEEILSEYDEVLHRSKFDFSDDRIQAVVYLVKTGLLLEPTESGEAFPDFNDCGFYEVALSKDGAYMVTGTLRHFPKTPIFVTPAQMMKIVEGCE